MRLEEKARHVNELIQREARFLSTQDANEVDRLLTQIRRVIRKDSGGDFDDGARMSSVTLLVDTQSYNFRVGSTTELVEACLAARAGMTEGVSEIEVSINYLRTQKTRNNVSWWRGSVQVCGVAAGLASNLGLDDGLVRRNHVIALSLEGREDLSFSMIGRNVGELGDICVRKISRVSLPMVDEMNMIVNGSGLLTIENRTGWWKNATEICQQVVRKAVDYIRE
jgi:phage shock protein PspC (stress-responsive transcriptional regulator)